MAKETMKLSLGRGKKGLQKSANLLDEQKVLAGTKEPLDTRKKVAKKAKVSHDTVAKVKVIEKEGDKKT